MSYRSASSYDPAATHRIRRPLRPYNWVQKLGAAFHVAAIAWVLAFALGELGWFGVPEIAVAPAIALGLIGNLLVNSRQDEGKLVTAEQRRRNAKWLAWTTIVLVVGAAALLLLTGGR